MTAQLDVLTKKLRSVEAEIEVELAKRAEDLRFRIENRKIMFEEDVKHLHRAIKVRASRYFIDANPLIVLSAPLLSCARWRREPKSIGARSSTPAEFSVRTRITTALPILATLRGFGPSSRKCRIA